MQLKDEDSEDYPRLKTTGFLDGGLLPPIGGQDRENYTMLTLKPIAFLTTEPSLRRAIDRLAAIKTQRKELEIEEEGIKTRLQQIALERGEDTLKGDHFEAQVVTEFQERINTPLLKSSLKPSDLASFTKTIKVVKVVVRPLTKSQPQAEAAE
jgi:hypothetical protein